MKRVCYKIFNNEEDLKVYLDKNKDKSCTGNKSIYASNLSNNTLVGEVKILSKEEVDKYLKEQKRYYYNFILKKYKIKDSNFIISLPLVRVGWIFVLM
ncbi:hypothetical protein [Clostridium sp.]|uniref:hypothetical protein n=1 Tax=Clostridium sp. TaxID=1506 RepID=UPI0037C06488